MSLVGAAAVSGAGSVLGSLISGGMNYRNTKKLMKYQNQMNIENWKMENQYNSPLAQVARLREAGLNPSLVYTGGTDNVGGTVGSSSPASMAGNVDFSQSIPSAVNTYFAAKMNQEQVKLMEGQIDAQKAQNNYIYHQTLGQIFANMREGAFIPAYKDLAGLTVGAAKANLEGSQLLNRLRGQQLNMNDVSMTKIAAEIDKIRTEGRSIEATVNQNWARIRIESALAKSNISVNDETIKKMSYEITNTIRSGNILNLEREMKQFQIDLQKQGKLDPGDNANFFENLAASLYNGLVYSR